MTVAIYRITSISEIQVQLFKEMFPENTWDLQHCQEFVENKQNYLLIAEDEGKPCGFLTAHTLPRLDELNPELFLYEIEVNSNYRRQGIGTQLIEKLIEIAKIIHAKEIFVLTNESNIAAMNLYQSTGGVRENPYDVMFVYDLNQSQL